MVVEAANNFLPALNLPDWTVTVVVWLAVMGFPAAVVLAWAFERTPEGLRLTDEAEAEELDAIVAGRRKPQRDLNLTLLGKLERVAEQIPQYLTQPSAGALEYRWNEGTLTNQEVDLQVEAVIGEFVKKLGAELRQ